MPPAEDLHARAQPHIGGSFGGFIAVIVVLVLVILVASATVFILLRRNITDSDRAARRQRRYQHSALPTSSSRNSEFDYNTSSQAPQSKWPAISFLSRLLSKGSQSNPKTPSYVRTRDGTGWQQADSGDEWDASDIAPGAFRPQMQQTVSTRELDDVSATHPPSLLSRAGAPAALTRNSTAASQMPLNSLPQTSPTNPPPSSYPGLVSNTGGDAISRALNSSPEPIASGTDSHFESPGVSTTAGSTQRGPGSTGTVASLATGTRFVEQF